MTKLVIFWDPIADFAAADYTDSADAMDLDAEAADADAAEMWKTGRLRNRWWGQLALLPTCRQYRLCEPRSIPWGAISANIASYISPIIAGPEIVPIAAVRG